jgi:hypothetical protein
VPGALMQFRRRGWRNSRRRARDAWAQTLLDQIDVLLFGVNYFFGLTTTISPYQRQLLLDSWAARSARRLAEGEARPRGLVVWFSDIYIFGAGGKWKTCFWFCTFPSAFVAGAVGMWESRLPLARFPRGSWKEGEACFWLSTLSTAPAFP